jgi:trehalose 6-phosphate phosphatase
MKEILRRIGPGDRLALYLDYDGTLVPLRADPEKARLRGDRRALLKRLGRTSRLAIVSGRSLADLTKLVALPDIAYVGNHGLEISSGSKIWIHPRARRIRPILRKALRTIESMTRGIPGILIEDKGVTASIHYRLVPVRFWKPLSEIVAREVPRRQPELRLTRGKRVIEIRPNVPWDKGRGVQELRRWLRLPRTVAQIYIGDDETDEDAFRVLGRSALTIHVGRRTRSRAAYRLAAVGQVWKLLEFLEERLVGRRKEADP